MFSHSSINIFLEGEYRFNLCKFEVKKYTHLTLKAPNKKLHFLLLSFSGNKTIFHVNRLLDKA